MELSKTRESTRKLFYENSHQKEFQAEVLSCEKDGESYLAVLDQTCFFPEGGGQYADTGMLGEGRVTDVQEKDGVIYHRLDRPVKEGTKVTGRLNWEERFEKMQQHTGEHIVSGLVHARFGYDNVGFHLGADYCTMDFNGPVSSDELRQLEMEANEAVAGDLEVLASYPSKDELQKIEYRSKIEIEGQVRLVTVPGYDVCACCAPHVKRTGEIGMIKLVNRMNYKGGVRLTMLCGFRALRDYETKLANAKEIGALLCEKENQIAEAVRRMKEELEQQKYETEKLRRRILAYKADQITAEVPVTCVFDRELTGSEPRELMNLILEKGAEICAVFAGNDQEGYRYVIGSRNEDVRSVGKKLNEAFDGRGGGKAAMIQGTLRGREKEIRNYIKEIDYK